MHYSNMCSYNIRITERGFHDLLIEVCHHNYSYCMCSQLHEYTHVCG